MQGVREYSLLTWNVRGLRDQGKRVRVRAFLRHVKPDVLCLQESKLEYIDPRLFKEIVGARLDKFVYSPSVGVAGGIILAWRSQLFELLDVTITPFSISAVFKVLLDNSTCKVTGVYGPASSTNRANFFQSLRNDMPDSQMPWILFGDFNQTINEGERSNQSRRPDAAFRNLIRALQLIDLRLHGRRYTWSNGRDNPSMVRHDRFLISQTWSNQFPNCMQTALTSDLSDHCPVLCVCKSKFPLPNIFRFENIWLKIPGFRQLVMDTWNQIPTAQTPSQLNTKLSILRKAIKKWAQDRVGNMQEQRAIAEKVLLWLDSRSEVRSLYPIEVIVQKLLRDRVREIETLQEVLWKQRAKRQWIHLGDKNTKYFHTIASIQKRKNSIPIIVYEGNDLTEHKEKARSLHKHFCSIMGQSARPGLTFDYHSLFSDHQLSEIERQTLLQEITEEEITAAVKDWKKDKSPGPDGFTGDFYRAFLPMMLQDLRQVFTWAMNNPDATMAPLDDSYIALVPKKKDAKEPSDFRPISLINGIQKLFSKVMASRLQPMLHHLLADTQTGFLKGRNILHGFLYAQELLRAAKAQNRQLGILKADIYKAFDSVEWEFVESCLIARNFPIRWVRWIKQLVLQGSSRVILNGVAGKKIVLKRGVRQGDPLSPYLFNLSIDFLNLWFQKLNTLNFIELPFPACRTCLLYADDTLLIIRPTREQLIRVGWVLQIMARLSGLRINLLKSELLVTAASPTLVQQLANQINCKPGQFPLTYLGLPLSEQQPGRAFFQQLVTKVQNRLQTWKASMLSIGGRLVLINAVLTSLPVYSMSVFKLPKWTIKKLDQTRRTFLWHGHKERAQGLNLISWSQVTLPKEKGGLGVKNLEIFNRALLMKWMWNWVQQMGSWWQGSTPMISDHVRPWDCANASKFWRQMNELSDIFLCSVTVSIGDGNRTSFWHDQWHGQALKHTAPAYYREFTDHWISVAQTWQDGQWNLPPSTSQQQLRERESLMLMLAGTQLHNMQVDTVQWNRSASEFTVKSAYNFMIFAPAPSTRLKHIWQIKAPLRIQVFTWRMLKNRLPTIDNLVARGWQLVNWCQLCKEQQESMQHMFTSCRLARGFRENTFDACRLSKNISPLYTQISAHELLVSDRADIASRQIEMATNFILWRERCRRLFTGREVQVIDLVRELLEEVRYWFPTEFQF